MSYDLCVWYQEGPATLADADRRYAMLCDSDDYGVVPTNPAVAAFVGELLAGHPWSPEQHAEDPSVGDDWVLITLPYSLATDVVPAIVRLAERHGLVCYDPQDEQVAVGGVPSATPELLLEVAGGHRIQDPHAERIEYVLTRLGAELWFARLTRAADGWWIQVGYGPDAGTGEGQFMVERQEGGRDRHYHAELTDLSEAIVAFQEFAAGGQDWIQRFVWW